MARNKKGKKTGDKGSKPIDKNTIELFEQTITQFEKSSQYAVLSSFNLGKILYLEDKHPFSSLLIEDLLQIDIKSLVAKFKLDQELALKIIQKLEELNPANLTEETTPKSSDPNTTSDNTPHSEDFEIPQLREVGIIEARGKMLSIIEKIKNASHYQSIASKTLEDFWERSWPSAPFEQSLTISQLCQVNVENLLKKRSLSLAKITAIINSLEKALSSTPSKSTIEDHSDLDKRTLREVPTLNIQRLSWLDDDLGMFPSYCEPLIKSFEGAYREAHSSKSKFSEIICNLPTIITAKEFLLLWFRQAHSPELVQEMLQIDSQAFEKQLSFARKKLLSYLQEKQTDLLKAWESILSSAGITLSAITLPYLDASIDGNITNALSKILLQILGAKSPKILDVEFTDLYTTNDQFLKAAIESVWATLPKTNFQVKRELKIFLPLFDQHKLIEVFSSQAQYIEKTDQWILRKSS